MAETIAAVGLRVKCHLLPEAGDGKDRVDRDFAGINKLFWSYLKQPGASMQNAVEMTKALEYGKRAGMVWSIVQLRLPDWKASLLAWTQKRSHT